MSEIASEAEPVRQQRRKSSLFRWLVFAQLLVIFLIAYVKIGGLLIAQTNHTEKDMFGGDQMHNMRIATWTKPDLNPDFKQGFTEAFTNFFPHRTDGVVQPLWPWVAAWFTHPGHAITEADMISRKASPEDFALFNRGRWFNVFLTATFLVFLGIAACRLFTFPAACNLILLGGFGALLPRAAYFQPEPLYFIFFFLTWVACLCALKRNSLWIYGLIGVLSGAAYMAKSSVHPLLMVFIAASTLRGVWEMVTPRRKTELHETSSWLWRNHLVGLVMLGLTHFMTIGPRLTESYEKFGDMFHSYPSYWMWMDRFTPDCFDWMVKYHSKETLATLTPDTKPSLRNYLRTHSSEEVKERLLSGTKAKLLEFFLPKQTKRTAKTDQQKPWRGVFEWRGWYLAWLAGGFVLLLAALPFALPKPEHPGQQILKPGASVTVLFVLGAFAGFSLAYGWYTPIGRGERFMMSLYLPLVFTLIWGSETMVKHLQIRGGKRWLIHSYKTAQWLLFAALCWRLFEIFRSPFFYN